MSTLSATITADTSQFNSAVTKAKGELEKFTDVSKKQRSEFDKAVRSIDRVRQGYVKGERATNALKSSVQKLTQLHAELKAVNNPLADSILRVASSAIKEKTSLDSATKSVKNFKRESNSVKSSNNSMLKSFSDVNNAVGDFAGSFGLSGGGLFAALSKISGPIAALTAAFAGVYEVVKSNEALFDAFQKRVEGVSNAFSNFKTLIGNGEFSINVLMKSYKVGKEVYDAKDAIGTAEALNSPYKAKLDARLAEAKLRKKEGDPKADAELDKLKSEYSKLYEEEKARQQELFDKQFKDIATIFADDYDGGELEKRLKSSLGEIYASLGNPTESLLGVWNNIIGYIDEYEEKIEWYNKKSKTLSRDKLREKDEKYVEALKKLRDVETSKIVPLALTSEQIQKLDAESKRIQGEVEEARKTEQKSKSKSDKSLYNTSMKGLYEELWSLEKVINEQRKKSPSERNTGLYKQALDKYKEIEGKLYERFALFESPDAQAFWKEWTNVEHAKLENKDVDKAIEEARSNLLKYANEKGLSIEEFLDSIKNEIAEFSKLWSWYGEVTNKYFNSDISNKILNNLGTPDDMRRLIQRSIDKEVTQLTSKYPNPKSPSYFKEVAGIYDKYLKYLVNYENEIETLQKEKAGVQEDLDSMTSGVGKEIYDREAKNLEYIYKAKIKRYSYFSTSGDVVDPKALEDAENEYKKALTNYLEYSRTYTKKIDELQRNVENLENNIKELEENQKPYQEMKETRDSFLQQAGIRPYPAFDFKDYREEQNKLREQERNRIEQIGVEVNAVNNLASSWSNLWEIIGVGNDKTKQTMQALGSAVTDATNMFKILAENELAASQAVALGKATSSASGLPFPYNLVAMGTVAATVTSMFARFASIGRFAEGGIVGGNSSIGDYNLARVNSGEMILNGTQQKRLFNMLNGEGGQVATNSQPQTVELVIRGKDLVGTFNNYNNRLNRVR